MSPCSGIDDGYTGSWVLGSGGSFFADFPGSFDVGKTKMCGILQAFGDVLLVVRPRCTIRPLGQKCGTLLYVMFVHKNDWYTFFVSLLFCVVGGGFCVVASLSS
jgi:hypothetical protein